MQILFYQKGAPLDELLQISDKAQPFCLESHTLVDRNFTKFTMLYDKEHLS